MSIKPGFIAAALLLGAALTLSGCAAGPTEPTSPGEAESPSEPGLGPEYEAEAVWLDNGRMIGVVTWGSSSCVPYVGEPTASGQDITVSLSDTLEGEEERVCTADMAPRVSVIGVPAGVNPSEDAEVQVDFDGQQLALELDGDDVLAGVPGESTDYLASAAWMRDEAGIVLLTWGSSTCPPIVQKIEESSDGVVATFQTQDGPCTMDMAPRVTILGMSDAGNGSILTLVGDNLDTTVQVVG